MIQEQLSAFGPEFKEIVKAADELEDYLYRNSGTSADWPIRITPDKDCRECLAALLNNLRTTLKPYRKKQALIKQTIAN